MVNVAAVEVPPPAAGLTTVTIAVPWRDVRRRDRRGKLVGETKAVARAAPSNSPSGADEIGAVDGERQGLIPGRRRMGSCAKRGQIVTVVLAVELLLPAAGSHEAGATLAVLVSVPPGVAVPTKVTVAVMELLWCQVCR